MRVSNSILVGALALAYPCMAGEYSAVSFGIQVDVAKANTTTTPFQNSAGNIQGADVGTLFGAGLTSQVRMGEIVAQRLSSLVFTPTLNLQYGRDQENRFYTNMNVYSPDGSVVSVQNANGQRTTDTLILTLSCPLRYYFGGSCTMGGIFVEAGPVAARIQQSVDLKVDGLVLASATTLSESAKITQNTTGITAALGKTTVYRQVQASYGLGYTQLSGKNGQKDQTNLRIFVSWTW